MTTPRNDDLAIDEERIVELLGDGPREVAAIMDATGLSYQRTIGALSRLLAAQAVELIKGRPPRYGLRQTDLLGGPDPGVASGS